jgi:hypothetical protein
MGKYWSDTTTMASNSLEHISTDYPYLCRVLLEGQRTRCNEIAKSVAEDRIKVTVTASPK